MVVRVSDTRTPSATTKRRITTGELFTLADAITKLSGESGHVSQYGAVTEKLNAALALVLDAAKSVAFQEARDAHNLKTAAVPRDQAALERYLESEGHSV